MFGNYPLPATDTRFLTGPRSKNGVAVRRQFLVAEGMRLFERPRATGVFPFRFSRQTISVRVGNESPLLLDSVRGKGPSLAGSFVARFPSLLAAEPVAQLEGLIPRDALSGMIGGRADFRIRARPLQLLFLEHIQIVHESLEQPHRDFPITQQKRLRQCDSLKISFDEVVISVVFFTSETPGGNLEQRHADAVDVPVASGSGLWGNSDRGQFQLPMPAI